MAPEQDQTQDLLDRARGGDEDAFEELFRRHRGRLKQVRSGCR
jgi:hypothetical protein